MLHFAHETVVFTGQQRICGVGNVYRAEILHLLGLHPDTPGAALPGETLQRMWALIVGLLRRGVEERRIVTTRGLALARPRERVPRAESTYVYGRKTCRTCGGHVTAEALRARRIYFCAACQPRVGPPALTSGASPPGGRAP